MWRTNGMSPGPTGLRARQRTRILFWIVSVNVHWHQNSFDWVDFFKTINRHCRPFLKFIFYNLFILLNGMILRNLRTDLLPHKRTDRARGHLLKENFLWLWNVRGWKRKKNLSIFIFASGGTLSKRSEKWRAFYLDIFCDCFFALLSTFTPLSLC